MLDEQLQMLRNVGRLKLCNLWHTLVTCNDNGWFIEMLLKGKAKVETLHNLRRKGAQAYEAIDRLRVFLLV